MSKIFGVLGFPVDHSLSPKMHNAALKELDIDASYEKFEVAPEDLEAFVQKVREENISGLSVTIPHKIEIMKYLDEVDEKAETIGACNTVINKNGVLKGTNTDCDGFLQAISEETELKDKTTLLLGCGGAARAALFALNKAGANVIILARESDLEEATKLASKYGIKAETLNDINHFQTEIIVNATPVGMEPDPELSPVSESFLQEGMTVFDMVYKPKITKLLQYAQNKGCNIVTGDNMLLYQGTRQLELFTGEKAPIEIMRDKLGL